MHNLREQRARSTEHYTLRNTDFVPAKALRCLQCLPTRALIRLCWAIQVAIVWRLRSPLVAQKVLPLAANLAPHGPLATTLRHRFHVAHSLSGGDRTERFKSTKSTALA